MLEQTGLNLDPGRNPAIREEILRFALLFG
jgi:hypothetical protein